MLKFQICTIDCFRDMEQTLLFGSHSKNNLKIWKMNTLLIGVLSQELAVQISFSYVAMFLRSSVHKVSNTHTHKFDISLVDPSFIE